MARLNDAFRRLPRDGHDAHERILHWNGPGTPARQQPDPSAAAHVGRAVGFGWTAPCPASPSLWPSSRAQRPWPQRSRPSLPPLPLPFAATGNEPGWRLDIADGRIALVADYGSTRLEMRAGEPQPVPGGRRHAGNADGRVLVVTVFESPL